MNRPAFARYATLVLAPAALLTGGFAAFAQDNDDVLPNEKVNQLIIYGDDACPVSTGDEIIVCARKEEQERYRIPEILRQSESPQNQAWNERVVAYETVGSFGAMSCTPSGYGGWTGCSQQLIDAAYKERAGSSDVRFSQLIEEERAKRLSTIDASAAAEQARVEELEKEYEARLKAERDAALPGEDQQPSLLPPAE